MFSEISFNTKLQIEPGKEWKHLKTRTLTHKKIRLKKGCQACTFNDHFLEVDIEKQKKRQFLRMTTSTSATTFSGHKPKPTNQSQSGRTNLTTWWFESCKNFQLLLANLTDFLLKLIN